MIKTNGDIIGKALYEAGLIPDNTRRIVIDIQCDSYVMIYYETYASREMMDITIESLIQHKDMIKVIPIEEIQQKQMGGDNEIPTT